jgi:hypothetical protein
MANFNANFNANMFLPNNHHVFSQSPQVFCEGVFKAPVSTSNSNPVSTSRSDLEITNHFIVLKWKIQRRDHNQNDTDLNNETVSRKESNDETKNHKSETLVGSSQKDVPLVFVIEKFSSTLQKWSVLGKVRRKSKRKYIFYLLKSAFKRIQNAF